VTLDFVTVAGTLGPTAAVVLAIWMSDRKLARDKAEDPVARLAEKLNNIEAHVLSIENHVVNIEHRVIDAQSEIKVLKDRRN
jgi:hypothetical protein